MSDQQAHPSVPLSRQGHSSSDQGSVVTSVRREQVLYYYAWKEGFVVSAEPEARGPVRQPTASRIEAVGGAVRSTETCLQCLRISREVNTRAPFLFRARISDASWLGRLSALPDQKCASVGWTELLREALEWLLREAAVQWSRVPDSFGQHFWLLEHGGKSVEGECLSQMQP